MNGKPLLRGYVDLGGYFMSVVRRVQQMVEWHEGVEPALTEVMLALQEDSVGTGKTAENERLSFSPKRRMRFLEKVWGAVGAPNPLQE
jgi:hypothetical protein